MLVVTAELIGRSTGGRSTGGGSTGGRSAGGGSTGGGSTGGGSTGGESTGGGSTAGRSAGGESTGGGSNDGAATDVTAGAAVVAGSGALTIAKFDITGARGGILGCSAAAVGAGAGAVVAAGLGGVIITKFDMTGARGGTLGCEAAMAGAWAGAWAGASSGRLASISGVIGCEEKASFGPEVSSMGAERFVGLDRIDGCWVKPVSELLEGATAVGVAETVEAAEAVGGAEAIGGAAVDGEGVCSDLIDAIADVIASAEKSGAGFFGPLRYSVCFFLGSPVSELLEGAETGGSSETYASSAWSALAALWKLAVCFPEACTYVVEGAEADGERVSSDCIALLKAAVSFLEAGVYVVEAAEADGECVSSDCIA